MSGELAMHEQPTRGEPYVSVSSRFLWLGCGTLAYTAAGWLDMFTAANANALAALCTFGLLAGGTVLLVRAVMLPQRAPVHPDPNQPAPRRARAALLAALTLSALLTLALAANLLASAGDTSIYDSDAAAFNQYNAALVLKGQNPYTADVAFWDALRQFPSVGATPLRAGRYTGSTYGPSLKQVVVDTQYERTHVQARGLEYAPASLHSYPALAFLVYVPSVWAGFPTTLYTSLLFLLAFFLAAGWGAPRRERPALWLLLLASPLLVFWTLRGSFEVVALLPALLAWRLMDRNPAFSPSKLVRPSLQSKLRFGRSLRFGWNPPAFSPSKLRFGGNPGWLSPLLLGLACAVKQIVWPFVPLYFILIWKREGPGAALVRLSVTFGTFLVPNLPFLLASPGAWVRSMLLPVMLPIFPSGVGLVGLARGGVLPLLPPAIYALLELAALVALAVWLARARQPFAAQVALLLGLLPFALSWHSLFTYFMGIPVLAVACAFPTHNRAIRPLPTETPTARPVAPSILAGPLR